MLVLIIAAHSNTPLSSADNTQWLCLLFCSWHSEALLCFGRNWASSVIALRCRSWITQTAMIAANEEIVDYVNN